MTQELGPKIAEGRTAEIFAWNEDQILKLYREGWSHRAVEFEHKQAVASQQTGYRVPQVGEIIEVGERIGILYQRIDGETIMSRIIQKPTRFPRFSRLMSDMHLEMHARNAQNLEPVTERLAGKIQSVQGLDQEAKNTILKHLFSLPEDIKLLHGDYHPGNILLTPNGPMIIDWIDAALGHPLADVARTTIIGNFGVPKEEGLSRLLFKTMVSLYLNRYFRYSAYTRNDLKKWLLPVAAGRLSENISHEKAPLHAFVNKEMQKLG